MMTHYDERRPLPRSLAGATIVQIVPALRDDAAGRSVLNVAYMLLQSGARAIVAGESGLLVDELKHFGGEWLALPDVVANPFRIRRNANLLEDFIAAERVDVVHAHSPGAAWSALAATARLPVWLLTNLPDDVHARSPLTALHLRAIAQGDRVLATSRYVAARLGARYAIEDERLSVLPRSIDTAAFDPATVHPDRVSGVMRHWGVRPDQHVVLVPGPLAPWNGQTALIDAVRVLSEGGLRGVVFVLLGDSRGHRRFARAVTQRVAAHGLAEIVRLPGRCPDMPAAYAAASLIVIPATEPPLYGRTAVEAQAMGRPVVASALGVLPETLLAPPRASDAIRTGWLAKPGDVTDLAAAIGNALALDPEAFQAMAIRARRFAEQLFSPHSVAAAHCEVYTSVLSRDR